MNSKLTTVLTWNPSSEIPKEDSDVIYWDGLMFHTYFYYGKTFPECEQWAYLPVEGFENDQS